MVAGWAWMKLVAGLGVVDEVVIGSFLGLPPWAYILLAVDLLPWIWLARRGSGLAHLGFFFFFFGGGFCLVMIFYKPHGGGWILMWDRQNVGFGGC